MNLCIDRVRRRREHVLSDKEEAILAAAGEMAASPDDIYSMLNDADLKFPDATAGDGEKHPVTHGTYQDIFDSLVLVTNCFSTAPFPACNFA